MDTMKKLVGGFLVLIAAFLLLKDAGSTSSVINSIGKGVGEVTTSLQGRS